jgi:predicted nuclease with TOPRIM domain
MSDETTIAEDVSRLRFLMRTLVQAGFWGTTSADALSVERICAAAEERDSFKAAFEVAAEERDEARDKLSERDEELFHACNRRDVLQHDQDRRVSSLESALKLVRGERDALRERFTRLERNLKRWDDAWSKWVCGKQDTDAHEELHESLLFAFNEIDRTTNPKEPTK